MRCVRPRRTCGPSSTVRARSWCRAAVRPLQRAPANSLIAPPYACAVRQAMRSQLREDASLPSLPSALSLSAAMSANEMSQQQLARYSVAKEFGCGRRPAPPWRRATKGSHYNSGRVFYNGLLVCQAGGDKRPSWPPEPADARAPACGPAVRPRGGRTMSWRWPRLPRHDLTPACCSPRCPVLTTR